MSTTDFRQALLVICSILLMSAVVGVVGYFWFT